ncbi:MAG: BREX system P-loop protein BrxC [Clostridia bacterium]|nr:BREX system P-loop protein BrxC [Clostridia bacterium]
MLNRDIYLKDPTSVKLVNEGVANVNDERTDQALEVLRYELETFVCDGQYEKGLNHILETYLKNINQAQQPSVWISGFYGSGKSHLAKMLRALWLDTVFPDGATARGIANLPQSTRDLLKELSIHAKRHGGLHAASGTLGSGSSNVRLALLGIVFKSCGLPELYPQAQFVMWLKREGIYQLIEQDALSQQIDILKQINSFRISSFLHQNLRRFKPNTFLDSTDIVSVLKTQFPKKDEITIDETIQSIRDALSINGIIPLTAIILDEMQQYIGDSSERSLDVQETIEACTKNIGGKLIIVATGQTAISGTANLKKLEGRFTIPIQLSDNDVDTVIRKVFLAKSPAVLPVLENVYKSNIGELSRHLSGTAVAHKKEDDLFFTQDYPILPVRRRFWEEALRVLDMTGTDSQLRNQLSTIHKAIKTNVDKPIGNVIPADYLYFDSAIKLLQARLLPSKVYDQTMLWIASDIEDERLLAKACGLIFLINKINAHNPDLGIRAVTATLADLMLEDITTDNSALRSKLPKLMDTCSLLMKVKDEYRIQTEESVAWDGEFQTQKLALSSSSQLIDSEREERIKLHYASATRGLSVLHGKSKVPRETLLSHTGSSPVDHKEKLYIWLRNGWSVEENSARVDAKQLGNDSPLVTVYLPKKNSDAIRASLIELKAADNTLRVKGNPNTPEGIEARSAIETIKNTAELKLDELFQELFSEAKVIQAGGSEISEANLKASLESSLSSSLLRLYPKFSEADDSRWSKVYEKAMHGAPDALSVIDYSGEAVHNPICKAILSCIGNGKKGDDIRKHFDKSPYGWPRDAIDGAIAVLIVAGIIKALDERNQIIEIAKLERKAIGRVTLKSETVVISNAHRISIRRLYQKLGITCPSGDEYNSSGDFIVKLKSLIDQAGGDAPLPNRPSTDKIDEIKLCSGNERLMAIYNACEELSALIDTAKTTADQIAKRQPHWRLIEQLQTLSEGLPDLEIIQSQIQHIKDQRLLLADPDPVIPILSALSQNFREELNRLKQEYDLALKQGKASLVSNGNWQTLEPEQQEAILKANQLDDSSVLTFDLSDTNAILKTLSRNSLSSIKDRIAAISGRFNKALEEAAVLLEPQCRVIKLPSHTLRTADDVDAWLQEMGTLLKEAIANGPIILQ